MVDTTVADADRRFLQGPVPQSDTVDGSMNPLHTACNISGGARISMTVLCCHCRRRSRDPDLLEDRKSRSGSHAEQ
jgi:hypothetical protein